MSLTRDLNSTPEFYQYTIPTCWQYLPELLALPAELAAYNYEIPKVQEYPLSSCRPSSIVAYVGWHIVLCRCWSLGYTNKELLVICAVRYTYHTAVPSTYSHVLLNATHHVRCTVPSFLSLTRSFSAAASLPITRAINVGYPRRQGSVRARQPQTENDVRSRTTIEMRPLKTTRKILGY